MYKIRNYLADFCGFVKNLFEEMERRLRTCPTCGRSRFYGKACAGEQ